jgi:hypothetical protein
MRSGDCRNGAAPSQRAGSVSARRGCGGEAANQIGKSRRPAPPAVAPHSGRYLPGASQHGSIALVERFIRTFKEFFRPLPVVPRERIEFVRELQLFQHWFNEHRPHDALGGRTPDQVYKRRFPANRKPRFEPRARWKKAFPCARPWALTRGSPGARLELNVEFHDRRRHLPIVTLRRVA